VKGDTSAARTREAVLIVGLVLFFAFGWGGIGYALGGVLGAIWSMSTFTLLAFYLAIELEQRR